MWRLTQVPLLNTLVETALALVVKTNQLFFVKVVTFGFIENVSKWTLMFMKLWLTLQFHGFVVTVVFRILALVFLILIPN